MQVLFSNKTGNFLDTLRCELKSTDDANKSPSLHHNFSFALKIESYIAFFTKIQRCYFAKSPYALCSFGNPVIFPVKLDVWLYFTGLPRLKETCFGTSAREVVEKQTAAIARQNPRWSRVVNWLVERSCALCTWKALLTGTSRLSRNIDHHHFLLRMLVM